MTSACRNAALPWHLDPFNDRFVKCCQAARDAATVTPEQYRALVEHTRMLLELRPAPWWFRALCWLAGRRDA